MKCVLYMIVFSYCELVEMGRKIVLRLVELLVMRNLIKEL